MLWEWGLFTALLVGSISGVFYPILVRAFKGATQEFVGNLQNNRAKWWIATLAGVAIGLILALISFGSFLGSKENQAALLALGFGAYFLAFTAGFTASSAAEELARTK